MSKVQGIIAVMDSTTVSIAVTGAPGGAGVATGNTQPSSSVMLTNTSNGGAIEYKAGSGNWATLMPSDGIELPIDLATTALLFRRARYDGGLVSAQLVISGKPVLSSAEGGLPIATGGAIAAVITGSGVVGQPLTATLPAGVIGTLQFTKTLLVSPFTKSNIATAVANAVNSLQYTPSQADLPYRIGCDASNTVAPSAGVTLTAAPSNDVAPAVISAPIINGTPTAGAVVSSTAGSFNGSPTPTVVTTWRIDGVQVATGLPYNAPADGGGKSLVRRDTATNTAGSVYSDSLAVTIAAGSVNTAPQFTASPTISAATIGAPATYSTGAASGTPAPAITTELMVWGRPRPISTVLSEVQRSTIDQTTGNIAIRQAAANVAGTATRMSIPSVRAIPDTAQSPRWSQHPYFKGMPQVGRPVTLGGLTPPSGMTVTSNHKFCISDTAVEEGIVDATVFAAATATTGTTSGLNTQSSATATYPAGEANKQAYAIVSMSDGTNTIYFRTKSWKVLPAGVATGQYRIATAGGGKLADRIYTNNTGVQMNVFGYVDVVVGSVQHGALKVVLANLAMPDVVPGTSTPSINSPIGSGSDYTFLSACLCVPNAAAASCPSVLFGGSLGTITNGSYDIQSDAMNPSAFGGKTAQNPGDRLIFKYEIAIAPGGKLPYVSSGDLMSGTQAWLFNPANTTISNKNNGIASAYSNTPPTAGVGDGIPFDIIGLQLSGDALVDFMIGDSIAFNPQGRSYWAASHYLCDGYGSPVIANSNGGRVGATHALFNNHPYLQSKIKYVNRVFIQVGQNSTVSGNVGNSNALIALDNTTLDLIAANAAPSVAGLTPITVVRMKLLFSFAEKNPDDTLYSSTTAETQSPVPSFRAGGDLETYFYPYLESQVPAKYARVLDVRPALRLSDDQTSLDYYKAQPNTFAYEGAGAVVVHPSILGGIQAGLYLRDLI